MTQTIHGHVSATIVRPRKSMPELLAALVAHLLGFVVRAALLCWLLPVFTPWHLSYDQSLAAVLLVIVMTTPPGRPDYLEWTKEQGR